MYPAGHKFENDENVDILALLRNLTLGGDSIIGTGVKPDSGSNIDSMIKNGDSKSKSFYQPEMNILRKSNINLTEIIVRLFCDGCGCPENILTYISILMMLSM